MPDSMGPPKSPEEDFLEDLSVLMPGRRVELIEGGRVVGRVKVYPVALRDMKKFAKDIGNALLSVANLRIQPDSSGRLPWEQVKLIIPLFADIVIADMLDLVIGCTKPSCAGIAHWHLPAIAQAWIAENFGSENRIRPWVQAIETLIFNTTGQSVSLWETCSQLLSPAAIQEVISSMFAGQTSKGSSSRTAGGQSGSSGSSQTEQQTSSIDEGRSVPLTPATPQLPASLQTA